MNLPAHTPPSPLKAIMLKAEGGFSIENLSLFRSPYPFLTDLRQALHDRWTKEGRVFVAGNEGKTFVLDWDIVLSPGKILPLLMVIGVLNSTWGEECKKQLGLEIFRFSTYEEDHTEAIWPAFSLLSMPSSIQPDASAWKKIIHEAILRFCIEVSPGHFNLEPIYTEFLKLMDENPVISSCSFEVTTGYSLKDVPAIEASEAA